MKALTEITAVILAGGLGTRLRETVPHLPKVLAEVNGRPFITYLLSKLLAEGVKKTVLCTGYLAETVEKELGQQYGGMELQYSVESFPLGTGGALRQALPLLDSDPVLVLNGDSYVAGELSVFWRAYKDAGVEAALLLVDVPDVARYGAVDVGTGGMITQFLEKGGAKRSGLINAGVYLFSKQLIAAIPADREVSLEKEVLPLLLASGVLGVKFSGSFIDIGIAEDYYRSENIMKAPEETPAP